MCLHSHEYSNLICQLILYKEQTEHRNELLNQLSTWVYQTKDMPEPILSMYEDAYFDSFATKEETDYTVSYFWSQIRNGKFPKYHISDRYKMPADIDREVFAKAVAIQDYIKSVWHTEIEQPQILMGISALC